MPARRKTPGAKGAAKRSRPKGSPPNELRAWAEDWVLRAARERYPTGFERDSEEELVAVGTILLELGGDPNGLVLDAAVTALQTRCGKHGPQSRKGRKADSEANRRQDLGERMVGVVAEMSEAAAGTRSLPEPDRLEEMAVAAAGELARRFNTSHEDTFGEKASEDLRAFWWTRSLHFARDWIAAHPAVSRALLDRTPGIDWIPGTHGKHEEAALDLLETLGPLHTADVPSDTDKLRSARASIGRRSREARRKAMAAKAALSTE